MSDSTGDAVSGADWVEPTGDPTGDLEADPRLIEVVWELERHAATEGWDRPARLYALVDAATFAAQQQELAEQMGLTAPESVGTLVPIEQDQVDPSHEVEQVLTGIGWPVEVSGCAVVVERLVLPPEVDAEIPADPQEALLFAAGHPAREEVRITAAAMRDGATYCCLRMRSHDEEASVLTGVDLVPELLELVAATLEDPAEPLEGQG